jgi:hypothetical protein
MGGNDQGEPGQHAGVFGNLPASRPGTRSPRRVSTGTDPEPQADEPPPRSEPIGVPEPEPTELPGAMSAGPGDFARTAAPGEAPDDPAPTGEDELEDAAETDDEGPNGGLEDLAWAGVAAAAEAATIGVRLASRAMEALRESVDRR